jgi:hypothetical protein
LVVPFDQVREWLYEHGYRDHYPRRDAADPSTYFYTFVKDGRRPILFPVLNGAVDSEHIEMMKREVANDEQRDREQGDGPVRRGR